MQILPPPDNAYLQPLTSRIVEGRTITPYDYRTVAIPLYTTLTASVPRGAATYTLPTNMKFRVRQLIPHIALLNPSDATETFGGALVMDNGGVMDRIYTKAMNCRVNLSFQSRAYEVMPNLSFPLSDLLAQSGEAPSFLDMPGSLIQGTTVDINVGLSDTSAAFSPTEYGIILVGAFIRVD